MLSCISFYEKEGLESNLNIDENDIQIIKDLYEDFDFIEAKNESNDDNSPNEND